MSLLDLIAMQRILHNGAELFRRKRVNFVGGTVTDDPALDATHVHLADVGSPTTAYVDAGDASALADAQAYTDAELSTLPGPIAAHHTLAGSINYDLEVSPSIDLIQALAVLPVGGSGLGGIKAPADTTRVHSRILTNISGLTITVYHLHASNAHTSSRIYFATGGNVSMSGGTSRVLYWLPTSKSPAGYGCWYMSSGG